MKRIAITGSNGIIGTVLRDGLIDYEITSLDLPDIDARNYKKLLQVFPGHDSVIHLAWDTKGENWKSEEINPDNILMTQNVYMAAIKTGVPRVLMASSVHTDSHRHSRGAEIISPFMTPVPDSPYGADKVFMETLGKYFATRGLEVVCIRFGGVNRDNKPPADDDIERSVWLSHGDCVGLVRRCLEADTIPDNYLVLYGVSNNKYSVHDTSNPLGWKPQDKAEFFMKIKGATSGM